MGAIPIGVSFSSTAVMVGDPTWTSLDATYTVTGWTIDRGRSYELDRTGTGTATVDLIDDDGSFDPTSTPLVDVMHHAAIALENPVTGSMATLFRGYVSRLQWTPHTTEDFAYVRLELVDAMAILAATELPVDGSLSGATATVSNGNLVFPAIANTEAVQARIGDGTTYGGLLSAINWPTSLRSIFTGNVKLQQATYPPRTSALTVIMDAADAEFPGVANVYVNKEGKVTFHGRLARFNPSDSQYEINTWNLGDATAVSASTVVPVSPPLVISRDDSHLYTSALSLPQWGDAQEGPSDIANQYVTSAATATYGLRTWSAENLLTGGGTANTALQETKLFGNYYTTNYDEPRTRVGQLTIRPQPPLSSSGATAWALMCGVDISDVVNLITTHVGGGGFSTTPFYVEGISYEARPLNADYHDVTLTLDVSPASYFDSNPF